MVLECWIVNGTVKGWVGFSHQVLPATWQPAEFRLQVDLEGFLVPPGVFVLFFLQNMFFYKKWPIDPIIQLDFFLFFPDGFDKNWFLPTQPTFFGQKNCVPGFQSWPRGVRVGFFGSRQRTPKWKHFVGKWCNLEWSTKFGTSNGTVLFFIFFYFFQSKFWSPARHFWFLRVKQICSEHLVLQTTWNELTGTSWNKAVSLANLNFLCIVIFNTNSCFYGINFNPYHISLLKTSYFLVSLMMRHERLAPGR